MDSTLHKKFNMKYLLRDICGEFLVIFHYELLFLL